MLRPISPTGPMAGIIRGYKSDALDVGHRVPCVARWPGVIGPGTACDQLACLSDLMATCAEIVGAPLPATAGEDSVSLLPLFGDPDAAVRDHVVHHSIDGKFALRDREWKLVLCPGSGGWTRVEAELDSGDEAYVMPRFVLYGNGTAWFDDVMLEKIR